MKTMLTIIAALLLAAATAGAQTMGTSAGQDLDALWARAQAQYDLAKEDAVILLDSRTVTLGDEGTIATRVHQVVWIGTSRGIGSYADLRVPWNSADSTLDVELLRTWRGGCWWPDAARVSDTAVVETLPYAVAQADDYTTLRETMLLHDGIELPCILETAYTIARQGAPTAGADELYVLPQRDPVLHSQYVLRAPLGTEVTWTSLNRAPDVVVTEGELLEGTWTMEGAGALKLPLTAWPALYEPAVGWSTWSRPNGARDAFRAAVRATALPGAAAADSVWTLVRGLPAGIDRVQAVVDFVNRSVRPVHTDLQPWLLAPRTAERTFATGYGHALDRAVLAAALFNVLDGDDEGGVVLPVFTMPLIGPLDATNGLGEVTGLRVPLPLAGQRLYYEPESGRIVGEYERDPVQYLGSDQPPRWGGDAVVDLAVTAGDSSWTGTGTLVLSGSTMPWSDAAAGEGALAKLVGAALGDVLPGLEVDWARPSVTLAARLGLRFGFHAPAPEADAAGRRTVTVGDPACGTTGLVPSGLNPVDDVLAPVIALPPGSPRLEVTVRLKAGPGVTVTAPEPVAIRNAAGAFTCTVQQTGPWLNVTRSLVMAAETGLPGASWPLLRRLLLEHADPAHRVIVLAKGN